jgi:hypothetical protein
MRRSPLRRILFSVIILLALLLAFEVAVTILSERGIQKGLESQYGLPNDLKVSINSFPLTLSLIRNHLGQLKMTWEDQARTVTGDGHETDTPYYGQINLYDVELNMPALLRTRIEIRKISYIKAAMIIDAQGLNKAFSLPGDDLIVDQGEIYRKNSYPKVQYKVEVLKGDTLSLVPISSSIENSGSSQDSQSAIEPPLAFATFSNLPLQTKLESASVEGAMIVIDVSIPMWEGYIQI